ncbi:MAG TPA: TRAP transporter substrate-binding protein [Burkholderiaceae bacterium]|nr:TRAP transporter substrate-binding protein [Burkholderiaceae bacterium]
MPDRPWIRSRRAVLGQLLGAAGAALALPARAQPITLKFATALPPGNPIATIYDPWVKAVNEAAQGEFQIQVVPGPTFASATNVWDRTVAGVADIGLIVLPQAGRPFPKSSVTLLPLGVDDCELGAAALWRLFAKGLIADEFSDVKLLHMAPVPATGLLSKAPITKLQDLKGQKIRAADKFSSDALSALGAAPIAVPFSESYQALSRGVVSAAIANPYSVTAFKLGEVAKHYTGTVSFGMVPSAVVMNKQAYDKLSAKGKAVIDRFTGEEASRLTGRGHNRLGEAIWTDIKAKGEHTFHVLPPPEVAQWQKALESVKAAWLAETPNGKAVHDSFLADYAAARKP